MKAGLFRFLWLWLPALAVFLAGLHRAWLTGQADPWDWSMAAAPVMAAAGFALARRPAPVMLWLGIGAAGMALLFCAVASARAPSPVAAAGLLAVAAASGAGGRCIRRQGRSRALGLGVLIVAGLLVWRGPAQPLRQAADRPKLAVITALPLFWAEPRAGGMERRDAPIVTVLRTRFTVEPLDDPLRLGASGARRLLLAQPRAMTPAQMVALDDWVRGGGQALVLADPALRWPSALPLGDRRRAPPVSLLGPLADHWGIPLSGRMIAGEERHFLPDGALVTLSGATLGPDGVAVTRRIGRGAVTLVGDADPIDDRLWLADPASPLDPRIWSADTPAVVANWLGVSMSSPGIWMRQADDVLAAIRWAVLAGTGWAMLGVWAVRGDKGRSCARTKRENRLEEE
ncbi:ABC transporter [Sphingobium amiense]|uniref:ABC transporter n=1 Tax=Sphingobium amiense TaxID=135719 RepID=A0A494W5A6_9SPHN|nr:ABC transporter [Sphingobium amiense]BBD98506.1 ABC transporter [Sphingobium amiense]